MSRGLDDARAWAEEGFKRFSAAVNGLAGPGESGDTLLPGWTRKHLVAHVGANADALGNLVHWADTGQRTPMYASLEQRDADIESGARLSWQQLTTWLIESERRLSQAMAALSPEQWLREVVTAQGRAVPASEVPWLRAREVWVHAVDLDAGVRFSDLPEDFLAALCDDAVAKRAAQPCVALVLEAGPRRWELPGTGDPTTVRGSLPELAAYLTGRPTDLPAVDDGAPPPLPPWL